MEGNVWGLATESKSTELGPHSRPVADARRSPYTLEGEDRGISIVTHEGLTTLAHPQIGWKITSGMWNTLRTMWGLNMETIVRIHESCKSQSQLESANIFTPTRHNLQAIRRTWKTDRVHVLPAMAAPTFFPLASKNNDTWWGSRDMRTVYVWDSMDNQDRQNTLAKLKTTSEWTI